jgi:hypothetical protein
MAWGFRSKNQYSESLIAIQNEAMANPDLADECLQEYKLTLLLGYRYYEFDESSADIMTRHLQAQWYAEALLNLDPTDIDNYERYWNEQSYVISSDYVPNFSSGTATIWLDDRARQLSRLAELPDLSSATGVIEALAQASRQYGAAWSEFKDRDRFLRESQPDLFRWDDPDWAAKQDAMSEASKLYDSSMEEFRVTLRRIGARLARKSVAPSSRQFFDFES